MKRWLAFLSLLPAAVAWAADTGAGSDAVQALNARLARAASKCTTLADLIACGDALNLKPNDAALLVAEGDALVRRDRPGEAIGVFRHALKQSADALAVTERIAKAEAQRRTRLEICETQDGIAGRSACEAAWLPGAPDEAAVFRRRGVLLQNDGQLSAALDAFMAAARLRPRDRDVALAILSLSERTAREDAATWSAKGQALLTLGRPAAALAPLRRALSLAPDLAEAKAHLKVAERWQSERMAAAAIHDATIHSDETAAATAAASAEPAPRYSNEEPLTRSN